MKTQEEILQLTKSASSSLTIENIYPFIRWDNGGLETFMSTLGFCHGVKAMDEELGNKLFGNLVECILYIHQDFQQVLVPTKKSSASEVWVRNAIVTIYGDHCPMSLGWCVHVLPVDQKNLVDNVSVINHDLFGDIHYVSRVGTFNGGVNFSYLSEWGKDKNPTPWSVNS